MAYNYDQLYGETPDALGDPTSEFVDFFAGFEPRGARVLDIGCGQGRDALFIARLGHHVVGVDISPNGIGDLVATAEKQGLSVEGVVADITTYVPDGLFDVVLIDRTLHMLPRGPRLDVLGRMLGCVSDKGWVLIADETSNIGDFKDALEAHSHDWKSALSKKGYLFAQRL